MPPPTRSHLRIYTSNSSNPNNPSSIIFPIHPPGPSVTSYAIRHNVASDSENVGLVVGRIYTDADLPTLERAEAEPGAAEGETYDENAKDKNAMDEIWRLRKKEQEELDLLSPALLLFHVYPTGSTFLEVPSQVIINPRTMVSLTRLTTGHTKPPLNRSAIIIPHSTPSHHILVFLDCDSQISVKAGLHTHKLLYQTVEMSIAVPSTSENNNGHEIYSTGREFIGDEGTSVKSVKSGEDEEGGLGTPPRDKVVTRVLDTPHRHALQGVMSQTQHSIFSNFDPTPDSGLASTARRLFPASEEVNKKEAETLAIDDGDSTNDEDIVPTIPTTLPANTGSMSIRVINTLSPSPSNRPNVSNPPSISNLPVTDPDTFFVAGTDASHSESEDTAEKIKDKEPSDSLPEAFKAAQEAKRLRYSPPGVKTYGHRKAKAGNTMSSKTNEDQHEGDGDVESLGEDRLTEMQESALSLVQSNSPVKKAFQGNSKVKNVKRKTHKREEKEITESSQSEPKSSTKQTESTGESMELDQKIGRKEEKEEEEEEDEREDKGNHVFAPTGKRPRLKRKSKYAVEISPVCKTQEEIAGSFDTEGTQQELEEYGKETSQTMGNVAEGSKGVKRKATGKKEEGTEKKKKENKKPPKKKAKVAKGDEKEDKGNHTQYTFVASQDSESENDEVGHTLVPAGAPIKTPAKRSRKALVTATPAKTPHTAISTLTPSLHGGSRTLEPYFGSSPKVVFSNSSLPNRKDHNNILRALGVKKAQNVTDAGVTHLVVGEGGLVRSSKLALALTLGLPIVTDSWLLDSYHNNPSSSASGSPTLLDSTPYIPSDPHNESAWQFSLPEAISRGKSGQLSTLLSTCSPVYLTPALLGHLKSTNQETGFMDILKATGAKKILKRAPKGSMEVELGNSHGGLVFGAGDGEKEVDLMKWEGGGWRVYKTEMLTMSILRGNLEVGAEFKLSPGDGVDKSQISEKGGKVTPAKSGKSGGAGGGRRKSGKF